MLRSCLIGLIALLIVGSILCAGPTGLYFYGQYTTLTCTHTGEQVDCLKHVTWLDLFPLPLDETLPHVTRAKVEVDCSSKPRSAQVECYANELVIENAERSFRFGSPYFNEDTAAETSLQINDYLRQPATAAPLIIPVKNTAYTIFSMGFILFLYSGLAFSLWLTFSKRPIIFFGRHIGGPRSCPPQSIPSQQKQKTKSKR